MATTIERLNHIEAKRAARLYRDARDAAGFASSSDYDTWLVLEQLRKLTLAERKAAADKANPNSYRAAGIVTLSGTLGSPVANYSINNAIGAI